MTDAWTLGYCTNVHAGTDLETIQANLDRYAVPVRAAAFGTAPMGVGLWIPAEAAASLVEGSTAQDFGEWLQARQLTPYTINGFPYANFHQAVVKHQVYTPAWWETARLDYTRQLATILARLLPAEATGSISTLPLGWPSEASDTAAIGRAGQHLRELSEHLARIEREQGRRIVVAIEPEPGCLIDRGEDMIGFFDDHLPETSHRRYLTVCHDVCHSAVMFEDQATVLRQYAAAGLGVGKVQVSNAIEVPWQTMETAQRQAAMKQLAGFAEDRYLHQTGRLDAAGSFSLGEDLPACLGPDPSTLTDRCWRIHFHVPIFLERLAELATTRQAIGDALQTLAAPDGPAFAGHVEVETYAWSVLPEELQNRGLVEDLAGEMRWLQNFLTEHHLPSAESP